MVVLREESREFSIGDDGRGIEIANLFVRVSKKVLLDLIEQIGGYDSEQMKRIRRLKKDGVANYLMSNFATDERGELSHPPLTIDMRGKKRKSKSKSLLDRKIEDPNPSFVKTYVKGTSFDIGKRPTPVKRGRGPKSTPPSRPAPPKTLVTPPTPEELQRQAEINNFRMYLDFLQSLLTRILHGREIEANDIDVLFMILSTLNTLEHRDDVHIIEVRNIAYQVLRQLYQVGLLLNNGGPGVIFEDNEELNDNVEMAWQFVHKNIQRITQ